MNKSLELCVKINDMMYELKTLLPRKDTRQKTIDALMSEYQSYFRNLYNQSPKAE